MHTTHNFNFIGSVRGGQYNLEEVVVEKDKECNNGDITWKKAKQSRGDIFCGKRLTIQCSRAPQISLLNNPKKQARQRKRQDNDALPQFSRKRNRRRAKRQSVANVQIRVSDRNNKWTTMQIRLGRHVKPSGPTPERVGRPLDLFLALKVTVLGRGNHHSPCN
ncbi:hypothetical protein SUGI_0104720 [Cryptomeria japonica]|nr:hypothetical protein SUGI_0104720 [Cryptomeria japonica]